MRFVGRDVGALLGHARLGLLAAGAMLSLAVCRSVGLDEQSQPATAPRLTARDRPVDVDGRPAANGQTLPFSPARICPAGAHPRPPSLAQPARDGARWEPVANNEHEFDDFDQWLAPSGLEWRTTQPSLERPTGPTVDHVAWWRPAPEATYLVIPRHGGHLMIWGIDLAGELCPVFMVGSGPSVFPQPAVTQVAHDGAVLVVWQGTDSDANTGYETRIWSSDGGLVVRQAVF